MKKEKKENGKKTKSVSEILTENIISLLEKNQNGEYNTPFWLEMPEKAVNAKSGRYYTGLNKFMLSPVVRKYQDNRFLTFKEISDMGGKIKKDEKGYIVYFSSFKSSEDICNSLREQCQHCKHSAGKDYICQLEENKLWQAEQAGLPEDNQDLCSSFEEKNLIISKYYRVWNVQQTDLVEKGILPDTDGRKEILLDETGAKSILMGMEATGLRIKASLKPNYDIDSNCVSLAGLPAFKGEKGYYYASMMKQLAFAAGAGKKYLNLPYMQADRDGTNPQENLISYGNLVAEMTASIIAGELGINYQVKRDIDYIIPLITKMEKDSRFIIMAANSANRIANYLLEKGAEYKASNTPAA